MDGRLTPLAYVLSPLHYYYPLKGNSSMIRATICFPGFTEYSLADHSRCGQNKSSRALTIDPKFAGVASRGLHRREWPR
jgi:hypothetical protein